MRACPPICGPNAPRALIGDKFKAQKPHKVDNRVGIVNSSASLHGRLAGTGFRHPRIQVQCLDVLPVLSCETGRCRHTHVCDAHRGLSLQTHQPVGVARGCPYEHLGG